MALLELKNLHVALEDGTEIVKGVDLALDTNEKHAIMGPNGSGKSTFAYALMGHPAYEITDGDIRLDGEVHALDDLGAVLERDVQVLDLQQSHLCILKRFREADFGLAS